jgi:hypothetical protein
MGISSEMSPPIVKNTAFMKEVMAMYQCLHSYFIEHAIIVEGMSYSDVHMSSNQFEPTILDYCISKLDDINLVECFQRFINVGFETSSWGEYTAQSHLLLYLDDRKNINKHTTIEGLRNAGSKLFDALLFSYSTNRDSLLTLSEKGIDNSSYQNDIKEMEMKALVYVYFFTLIKGNYPHIYSIRSPPPLVDQEDEEAPIFFKKVMNLTENPSFYCKKLCTFNIS